MMFIILNQETLMTEGHLALNLYFVHTLLIIQVLLYIYYVILSCLSIYATTLWTLHSQAVANLRN